MREVSTSNEGGVYVYNEGSIIIHTFSWKLKTDTENFCTYPSSLKDSHINPHP